MCITPICTDLSKIVQIFRCCRIFSVQNEKNPYSFQKSVQKFESVREFVQSGHSASFNECWIFRIYPNYIDIGLNFSRRMLDSSIFSNPSSLQTMKVFKAYSTSFWMGIIWIYYRYCQKTHFILLLNFLFLFNFLFPCSWFFLKFLLSYYLKCIPVIT